MVGDGVTDDTAAIQHCIDSHVGTNGVAYLPAGTYRITSTIRIPSNKVLRGAGSTDANRTTIILDSSALQMILIGKDQGLTQWSSPQPSNWVDWTSGYTDGTTTLGVKSSSGFSAGDMVLLSMDNVGNPEVVQGDCIWYGVAYPGGTIRNVGQLALIDSVPDGTHIVLKAPGLHGSLWSASYNPKVAKVVISATNAGVENLYLTRTRDCGGGNTGSMIQIGMATYCWVKNVEVYKMDGRAVRVHGGLHCTIRDSYFHHAWVYRSGARSYLLSLQAYTSDCLVENNIAHMANAAYILETAGTGNVLGYNYGFDTWLDEGQPALQLGQVGSHCACPHYNLIEGNFISKVMFDSFHGNAVYNTFFRNYHFNHNPWTSDPTHVATTVQRGNIEFYTSNHDNNVIGCVLSWNNFTPEDVALPITHFDVSCPSCEDPVRNNADIWIYRFDTDDVKNRTYRHGNWDGHNNATLWDTRNSDHTLPNSLYLTSKPAFFGNLRWPAIGPDLDPIAVTIPARERYYLIQFGPSGPPSPPYNLKIIQ